MRSSFGEDLTAPTTVKGSDISISVQWTDKEITIDGKLDDEAWRDSAAYEDFFFQHEPLDRVPSSEKTRIMVLQDKDTLYFGMMMYDSEPDKLFASAMRRDKNIWSDDVIELLIDTFRDNRTSYAFVTNPLGVKGDAIVSDEGNDVNKSWDCIWEVSSSINEYGWAAEMAIPFKSLKYAAGENGSWKLNITRNIKHRNETTYLVPIPRGLGHNGKFKGELYANLTNIRLPSYRYNIEVQPYIRTGGTWIKQPESSNDTEFDGGLDARWHVTPQFMVDATYNTDFAQIESEEEVVNVTRFNIYLPEKRDFFLENAGLFNFSMVSSAGEYYDADADFILFNSRTIGITENKRTPLYGGAKAAGRVGDYQLGFMNIQSEETSLSDGSTVPSTNFTAARIKRNLLTSSYVGMMIMNKQSDADDYNRTLGIDGYHAFTQELFVKGSIAKTIEKDDNGDDIAGDVRLEMHRDWIDIEVGHTAIDSLFNPEMGYVRRYGIRKSDGEVALTKWVNNRWIKGVSLKNGLMYLTDQGNVLQTRESSHGISTETASGETISYSYNSTYDYIPASDNIRSITIDAGTYNVRYHRINLSSYWARPVSGSLSYRWGELYDGHSRTLSLSNRTKFTNNLNMDLYYTYNHLDLMRGRLFANVMSGRWTYSFTTDMFAKVYIQWNDADERVSMNILYDYIYRPKSHIYLVYNENHDTALTGDTVTDRMFMVKATYMWNM